MLTYVYGDLFYSPAQVLVNPVNTLGTMSTGLSHDFKRYFPDMFAQYQALCQRDEFDIGQIMLYRTPHKIILNLPTRKHARAKARPDYVEAALRKFVAHYAELGLLTVSFPLLDDADIPWESELKPLMESYLLPLPISLYVHLPARRPDLAYRPGGRVQRTWLNGQPRRIRFERFWADLLAIVRQNPTMHTLDAPAEPFRVQAEAGDSRRRLSLKINPANAAAIFIPETLLRDLWQFVERGGYLLLHNLPGGLADYGAYLLPILSQLDYLWPLELEPAGSVATLGLHYIPPVEGAGAPLQQRFTDEA